jgi:hypothetical protein
VLLPSPHHSFVSPGELHAHVSGEEDSVVCCFWSLIVGLTFVDLAASGFMLAAATRRGGCRD